MTKRPDDLNPDDTDPDDVNLDDVNPDDVNLDDPISVDVNSDDLDDRSRAVLGDLFAAALDTPDPGSTVDLAAILAAARAAGSGATSAVDDDLPSGDLASAATVAAATTEDRATAEPTAGDSADEAAEAGGGVADDAPAATEPADELGRRRRLRVFQALGGIAAAAALVFGVTQLDLPGGATDAASSTQMPARAAGADAAATAEDGQNLERAEEEQADAGAAPDASAWVGASSEAAETSSGSANSAGSDGDQASTTGAPQQEPAPVPSVVSAPSTAESAASGGEESESASTSAQSGNVATAGCVLPADPVLAAIRAVRPGLTVVPISGAHGTTCEATAGARVITEDGGFDVLVGGPAVDALAATTVGPDQVQVVPLPGADAGSVEADLAQAVVAAVAAALA